MIRVRIWCVMGGALLCTLACSRDPSAASKMATDNLMEDGAQMKRPASSSSASRVADPRNAIFSVDGVVIILNLQTGEMSAASSHALGADRLRLLNGPIPADLDQDGDDDALLLLGLDSVARGTRYYIAPALRSEGAFAGGKALYLGEGISQPSIGFSQGTIKADYYFYPGQGFSGDLAILHSIRARWNGTRLELQSRAAPKG